MACTSRSWRRGPLPRGLTLAGTSPTLVRAMGEGGAGACVACIDACPSRPIEHERAESFDVVRFPFLRLPGRVPARTAALAGVFAAVVLALARPVFAEADDAAPVTLVSDVHVFVLQRDGSLDEHDDSTLRANDANGIDAIAQRYVWFDKNLEKVDLLAAETIDRDGVAHPVGPDGIRDVQEPRSAGAPTFQDGLLRTVAFAGLVMAAADYAFQRHRTGKQTRMSKEEVKQEAKQTEGDPLVKSAIRSRQLAAARNRMMQDVATADVVLINPTHVAVSLRYDPDRGAPLVVARGAGAVAARIRERAEESRVPLVRDVPLARALYSGCQVGQQIPAELFAAVAQVLAFVISRRATGTAGGSYDSPRTDEELPAVRRRGRRRR